MQQLQKGKFFGQTNRTLSYEGITITDTEYTHPFVDWHYHEHAYFTFLLQGKVIEGNKKETYNCTAGTLLFHNWQEPHYNIKPDGFTRGFQIEIEEDWFGKLDFSRNSLQGSINIFDPDIKLLMYKIFRETKVEDDCAELSIQTLLLQTLSTLCLHSNTTIHKNPKWVSLIDELLRDQFADSLTLEYLSKQLNIHPVHLSRDFPRYFNCNLGTYIRKLRIEKALELIAAEKLSLTAIAYECGFTDQSHFNRVFKEFNGVNPMRHRRILLG